MTSQTNTNDPYFVDFPGRLKSIQEEMQKENIDVYLGLNSTAWRFRKTLGRMKNALNNKYVNRLVQKIISSTFKGPSEDKRKATRTFVWGTVTDNEGNKLTEAYQTMEGYNLTAVGATEAAVRVMNNEVKPGTKSPSLAFGSSFMDDYVIKKLL